jgi:hypothetical protein
MSDSDINSHPTKRHIGQGGSRLPLHLITGIAFFSGNSLYIWLLGDLSTLY